MAKLSKNQVEHVAALAKLPLNQKEKQKFQDQLTNILDYMEQIKIVETEKVESKGQVTLETNRMREDRIEPSRVLPQDYALGQAKRTHNGFFVVDAILEK